MNETETLAPLNTFAASFGVRPITVWKWATIGVAGTKLQHLRIGGRLFTSAEALQRFHAKINSDNGNVLLQPLAEPMRSAAL